MVVRRAERVGESGGKGREGDERGIKWWGKGLRGWGKGLKT